MNTYQTPIYQPQKPFDNTDHFFSDSSDDEQPKDYVTLFIGGVPTHIDEGHV